MAAAGVVRKEKKKRKREKHDRGCPDVARDVEPQASDVAAAPPAVAAPPAPAVAAPAPQAEAAPAVAAPSSAVAKHTGEGTGTRLKAKSKKKKEKKTRRKSGQAQEYDGRSGTDKDAEDQACGLAAAAATARSSTTTPGTGTKAFVDGPGNNSEGDILAVNEAKQGEKPAKKRRKKGKRPPSSASPSSASPLVAAPAAATAAAAAPSPSVDAASPPALLCTGKVDEYAPISGEQSVGKGTGDGRGRSIPQGNSSRAKKKKDRRSLLSRRGEDGRVCSDHPQRGVAVIDSKDNANNDRDNHNDTNNDDDHDNDDNSNDQVEDEPLEGVVHDGAMFLVDTKRRVFSAQRDDRGDLVKVGRFDDDRGEVVLETRLQTIDGNPPEVGVGAGVRPGVGAVLEAGLGEGGGVLSAAEKALSKRPTSVEIDTGTTSGVPQGGGIAGGSATAVDGVETGAACNGKKKKKKKKTTGTGVVGEDGAPVGDKKESGSKLPGAGPRDVVEYPFEVEECDHCETGDLAYAHIAPLLLAIAVELGKTAAELVIYDPYFCQGSTVRRLASLGFPKVYNRNEDFYEAVKSGTIPEYDVLVTNPPFSGEHVPKILRFCARQGAKPWLLLMPNYVYLKDYYEPSLSSGSSPGATLPFYLTPPKRYMYYSPQGSRLNVKSSERKTSPFNTFWYIRLGDGGVTSKILQAYDARSQKPGDEPKCCVARTTQQIPYKMMDSNDPRRKKARDRQRSIDRIRKKKSEWVVS